MTKPANKLCQVWSKSLTLVYSSANKDASLKFPALTLPFVAEEVIKAWLSKVENHPGSYPSVSQASSSHEAFSRAAETGDQRDLLSGVDWEGGSAAETTKTILDALMTTEIPQAYCHVSGKARSYDPHVAMETRHKQVREIIRQLVW